MSHFQGLLTRKTPVYGNTLTTSLVSKTLHTNKILAMHFSKYPGLIKKWINTMLEISPSVAAPHRSSLPGTDAWRYRRCHQSWDGWGSEHDQLHSTISWNSGSRLVFGNHLVMLKVRWIENIWKSMILTILNESWFSMIKNMMILNDSEWFWPHFSLNS